MHEGHELGSCWRVSAARASNSSVACNSSDADMSKVSGGGVSGVNIHPIHPKCTSHSFVDNWNKNDLYL